MKRKISVTMDASLVTFLDSLPGKTRSEKLERILSRFRQLPGERELRRRLGGVRKTEEEQLEREAWEQMVAEAMWTE